MLGLKIFEFKYLNIMEFGDCELLFNNKEKYLKSVFNTIVFHTKVEKVSSKHYHSVLLL